MMKINFLEEEEIKRQIRWDQIFLVLMVVILLLMPAFHYGYHLLQLRYLERDVERLQEQTQLLQPEVEEYRELNEKISQYESMKQAARDRYPVDRSLWLVSEYITPALSLDSIDIFAGEMYVSGRALNSDQVVDYMENLEEQAIFSEARIDVMETGEFVNFSIWLEFARGEG